MFVGRVGPVDRRSDGERSRRPQEFRPSAETIDDGRIAAITLDRPEQRNAQTRGMLVDWAPPSNLPRWPPSGGDPAGRRPPSASHGRRIADDIRALARAGPAPQLPVQRGDGEVEDHATARIGTTTSNTKRWRSLRKDHPSYRCTGPCCRPRVMLAWCCDLIVASEGHRVGRHPAGHVRGQYFGHPAEFGPRRQNCCSPATCMKA